MPIVQAADLEALGRRIFEAAGASPAEAEAIVSSLVRANLAGLDSHGVIRIPQYLGLVRQGWMRFGQPVEVVRETATTAVLNGNWGPGQVCARRATELALDKARRWGLGAVGLHHSNHVGRLGEYVLQLAEAGLLGLAVVNNHGTAQHTAPFGGIQGRLATNPIAFAAPANGHPPLVLDMTTSIVAEGKIRVLRNRGQRVPEGWILDGQGRPTTDPNDFYGEPRGVLLPLGGQVGYKGFGLGLMVELLAGGLSGAGCSGAATAAAHPGNALFILAIAIDPFLDRSAFEQQVADFFAYVKSAPRQEGVEEILIPGEPEVRTEQRRRAEGIPVDEETWRQIQEAAAGLGVAV
jgi:uncharacterized oxidoreductase